MSDCSEEVIDQARSVIDKIMSEKNLHDVGTTYTNKVDTKLRLRHFVRGPRNTVDQSKRGVRKLMLEIKEDLKGMGTPQNHTAEVIVSRAVKAIVGAVFLDGGLPQARRVQAQLGIIARVKPR